MLFLGLLISVVAQLLLYRLLSAGNIVNVTSLFYLVPVITELLRDHWHQIKEAGDIDDISRAQQTVQQ